MSVPEPVLRALFIGPTVTLALLVAVEVGARFLGARDERRMKEHIERLFADTQADQLIAAVEEVITLLDL